MGRDTMTSCRLSMKNAIRTQQRGKRAFGQSRFSKRLATKKVAKLAKTRAGYRMGNATWVTNCHNYLINIPWNY